MKYKHLRVSKVTGFVMPEGKDELALWQDESSGDYLLIASKIDDRVLNYDRRMAIASLALDALIGRVEIPPDGLQAILEAEVSKLQKQRSEKFGSGPYLLFEVSGEAEYDSTRPFRDIGEFSIGIGNVDIKMVKDQSIKRWRMYLTAFLLIVNGDILTSPVIDGIYLIDAGGKIHFVLSFVGGSANLTVSRQLGENPDGVFERLRESLFKDNKLQSISRLLVQATTEQNDNLRGFIFAWTGLEMFIHKTFKLYEDLFIEQNTGNSQTPVSREFFKRIREVMNDKYRLLDKFMVISSSLSPDAESDVAKFAAIKKIRDGMIHGEEINEERLPVNETIDLLRKYLKLHLLK